jgi:hypothetical protein
MKRKPAQKIQHEPMTVALPAEEGFVVLTRWQVEYITNLLQAITTPRINAIQLTHNKTVAYEDALRRCAENANTMWKILSDSNVIPPPSPQYGVETECDRKARAESNKAREANNSLRSAYGLVQLEKGNAEDAN